MKGMPDARSDQSVVTAPVDGGGETGVVSGITVTLRPRLGFRAIGPVLILAGIAGIAAQFLPAIGALAVGGIAMAAWLPTLRVDEHEIRLRGLWTMTTIPLDTVDQIRLRRVPFGPKHALRRVYRMGPFCSTRYACDSSATISPWPRSRWSTGAGGRDWCAISSPCPGSPRTAARWAASNGTAEAGLS